VEHQEGRFLVNHWQGDSPQMVHTWMLRGSISLCSGRFVYFGGCTSCCQLFLGSSAAYCKFVATAELIVVIVVLSRSLLLRQLFIRHVAT
jgi:hypothetical protein